MNKNLDWRDSSPIFLRNKWPIYILSCIALCVSTYVYLLHNMVIGVSLFGLGAILIGSTIKIRWLKFLVWFISIAILGILCFHTENLSQPLL